MQPLPPWNGAGRGQNGSAESAVVRQETTPENLHQGEGSETCGHSKRPWSLLPPCVAGKGEYARIREGAMTGSRRLTGGRQAFQLHPEIIESSVRVLR